MAVGDGAEREHDDIETQMASHRMFKRFTHWRRMYRSRGAAKLPFWPWLKWAIAGESESK